MLFRSIAEQFEVVQRWCSGGNSTGVLSAHADPLLGVAQEGQQRVFRFMHPSGHGGAHEVHRMALDLGGGAGEQLVTLRWGAYFFMPSIQALHALADALSGPGRSGVNALDPGIADRIPEMHNTNALPTLEKYGERVYQGLGVLLAHQPAPVVGGTWKAALEDPSARGAGITEGIWAHAATEGMLRSPYGVLVADPERALQILNDGTRFSVRPYLKRLQDAGVGDGFVGMDPEPQETHSPDPTDRDEDAAYRSRVSSGRYQAESVQFKQAIAAIDEQIGRAHV